MCYNDNSQTNGTCAQMLRITTRKHFVLQETS